MESLKFFALLLLLFATACGGQSGGFAPGAPQAPVTPPVVDTSGDHLFKYGQITTTSGGWVASFDSSDPVEEITLANGWTIEVKNE